MYMSMIGILEKGKKFCQVSKGSELIELDVPTRLQINAKLPG